MTTTANTVHVRAGEQSNAFTREFAAPVALVFRAHIEPELFAQWVGPRGTTCAMRHFDARTGGAFSYVVADAYRGAQGEEVEFARIVADADAGHEWSRRLKGRLLYSPRLEMAQVALAADGEKMARLRRTGGSQRRWLVTSPRES